MNLRFDYWSWRKGSRAQDTARRSQVVDANKPAEKQEERDLVSFEGPTDSVYLGAPEHVELDVGTGTTAQCLPVFILEISTPVLTQLLDVQERRLPSMPRAGRMSLSGARGRAWTATNTSCVSRMQRSNLSRWRPATHGARRLRWTSLISDSLARLR